VRSRTAIFGAFAVAMPAADLRVLSLAHPVHALYSETPVGSVSPHIRAAGSRGGAPLVRLGWRMRLSTLSIRLEGRLRRI